MTYNSFYTNILIRILLLVVSIFCVAYLFIETNRFFSILFTAALIVGQIISLIYYLNKTNKNLAHFLLLLTEEDTSVLHWKNKVEKTFQGLHHSFRRVNEEITRIKLEKEYGSILLENLIEQLHTGVIVAEKFGTIEVVNTAALRVFGINGLKHLNELNQLQNNLSETLIKIRFNEGNVIQFQKDDNEIIPLLVKVSSLKLGDQSLKLFSIQNIKTELEAKEIESWQQMTRVLAHEISNSVTPLATLGSTIKRLVSKSNKQDNGTLHIEPSTAKDIIRSAELIESRGDGLIEFIEHYKSFAKLPNPDFQLFSVKVLFDNISNYFSNDFLSNNIKLVINIQPEELSIVADLKLLDQALINIMNNSIEALVNIDPKTIELKAYKEKEEEVTIMISDNGSGITPDIQSKIFIPFFTTNPKGTGIGLSVVRKIVLMHGGTIYMNSTPGHNTTFILKFPAI